MIENLVVFGFVFLLFAFIIVYAFYNRRASTSSATPPVSDGDGNTTEPPTDSKPPTGTGTGDDEFDDPNASRDPPARVVGYYTNWARYRVDGAECMPSDIPTDCVTDIVYAFFPINDQGIVGYSDPWADINMKGIEDTIKLRGTGRVKHVLYSVGGWTYSGPEKKKWFLDENSEGIENKLPFMTIWDRTMETKEMRGAFIKSAIMMMNRHGFDGIDIDYEYPACPQGECLPEYSEQSKRFVMLLTELRAAIGKGKLITLATAAADKNLLAGPDMKQVTSIVDYLNVMTYDYFVWVRGGKSGHNQPKRDTSDGFDVNHTLWRYIKLGCDPKKLNIGLACYGRGYKIGASDFQNAIKTKKFNGLVSVGASHSTKWTQQEGVVSFYEMCTEFKDATSIYVEREGSWLCDPRTNEIISYTDLLDLRALNEIRIRKKIGGLLIYAVDQDDYLDRNGFGKYPLIRNMLKIEELKPTANLF